MPRIHPFTFRTKFISLEKSLQRPLNFAHLRSPQYHQQTFVTAPDFYRKPPGPLRSDGFVSNHPFPTREEALSKIQEILEPLGTR